MKSSKRLSVLAPILSVAVVGTCIGISLTRYNAPVYQVQAFENDLLLEEPQGDEEIDHDYKMQDKNDEQEDEINKTRTENIAAEFELEDGIYEGSGIGFSGIIRVSVEIKNKKIVSINIISNEDDEAFFNRAKAVTDSMIAMQSTDVDVVSGTTYSSKGIIEAVKNAVRQAIVSESAHASILDGYEKNVNNINGSSNESNNQSNLSQSSSDNEKIYPESDAVPKISGNFPYDDGVYYGSGEGFSGEVKVSIELKDHTIVSVNIISTEDDEAFFNRARSLVEHVIQNQETEVDTISGATFSSNGIIDAINDALAQAEKATENAALRENLNDDENEDENEEKKDVKEDNENDNAKSDDSINDDNKEDDNKDDDSKEDDNKDDDSKDEDQKEDNNKEDDEKDDISKEDDNKTIYKDGTYYVTAMCTPDEDEMFDEYQLSWQVIYPISNTSF